MSFYIDAAAIVAGSRVGALPLPDGANLLLLVRDGQVMAVNDDTILQPGDHAHMLIEPERARGIELLFGLREED